MFHNQGNQVPVLFLKTGERRTNTLRHSFEDFFRYFDVVVVTVEVMTTTEVDNVSDVVTLV